MVFLKFIVLIEYQSTWAAMSSYLIKQQSHYKSEFFANSINPTFSK
ncbi:hypothetical protein VCHA43P277_30042 [Vibrio chagasii]|nr:hypothetical protein VCHA35P150_120073 [Vibrio chagasii]CAK2519983.1 hypothetical protein VCRA2111O136_50216 [Vibrio crassostreae]CAH6831531.1 hypothetical protein VCHA28FP16_180076 [Vibrio chagasii]CAH6838157.1 hypothetical protein VCHA35O141_10054 [Vibrio chagasii]CAH6846774.1 hypothetical protein VCHA32O87_10076 [Vibrio chagasii]